MTLTVEQRPSDSPYVGTITRGHTLNAATVIRPAECHWHMVIVKHQGHARLLVVGPWSNAGVTTYGEGAEILWIQFTLGAFMPHLPTKDFLNSETVLPGAAANSFWLRSSAWQLPDYENADTFVDRLAREDVLVRDPVVDAALRGRPQELSPRTMRHRFRQATGLTRGHIRQVERAQRAAALLRQGAPILDTVFDLGYFDQPHLTRSLKQWVGYTPAQLARLNDPG
jgi:hypothetical protein